MIGEARRWTLVGAVTLLAALTLGVSYALPTVTFQALASPTETYSIWGGIVSLWKDGNVVLAPIVFVFSIVFPIAKLILLGWLWRHRRVPGKGDRLVDALQLLGKWSMLDVLIVGLFVGAIRIGIATASTQPGILVFAGAIVLSMLAARLAAWAQHGEAGPPVHERSRTSWLHRVTSLAAAVTLAGALLEPIFRVTKGLFFSNEVALVATGRKLAGEGEAAIGIGVLAAVALLPALRTLLSLRLAFLPGRGRLAARAARLTEEWAMIDVFALALAIVHVKLAELATANLLPGFWWALAAAVCAVVDGVVLRLATRIRLARPPVRATRPATEIESPQRP